MIQYPKSKKWLDSAKDPMNSIFDEIKQSLILDPLDLNVDQFDNRAQKLKYMVIFSISNNPMHSIFVEIKQILILDPDLHQLENWAHNKKPKDMFSFSIWKYPKNSFFF